MPRYDAPTGEQPPNLFMCHQTDGRSDESRLCAGWVGAHDMNHNLALRLAPVTGSLTPEQVEAVLDYTTDVALFASGAEAADHGLADVEAPDEAARKAIGKLQRKRAGLTGLTGSGGGSDAGAEASAG